MDDNEKTLWLAVVVGAVLGAVSLWILHRMGDGQ